MIPPHRWGHRGPEKSGGLLRAGDEQDQVGAQQASPELIKPYVTRLCVGFHDCYVTTR